MHLLPQVFIIFIAFGGFLLAFYIRHKKGANEKLVCPIGASCDMVVHSQYSKFFGMPVELLGMIYYGIIALGYGALLAFPEIHTPFAAFVLFGMTIAAFLFSLYLTFIQAFSLKQWCTWCLTSAGFCVTIFYLSVLGSEFSFLSLLEDHKQIVLLLHVIGTAVGVGTATITDVLFFKFLRDFKVSEMEADILNTLSQVVWAALAIIVLSGLGLFLPDTERLLDSQKFLIKMVVVGVIIVNGAFLNLKIAPSLVKISFGEKHEHQTGELRNLRRIAFASGGISIVSWYSALILGTFRSSPAGFSFLFSVYTIMFIGALFASQVIEHRYAKKSGE